jgi:hypothetical protein
MHIHALNESAGILSGHTIHLVERPADAAGAGLAMLPACNSVALHFYAESTVGTIAGVAANQQQQQLPGDAALPPDLSRVSVCSLCVSLIYHQSWR